MTGHTRDACPECGAVVPTVATFCAACGSAIGADATADSSEQATLGRRDARVTPATTTAEPEQQSPRKSRRDLALWTAIAVTSIAVLAAVVAALVLAGHSTKSASASNGSTTDPT